jgi:rhomboid protease GluP
MVLIFGLAVGRAGFSVGAAPPALGLTKLALLSFGAKFGPLIAAGDFWRFASCLLLHRGVVQLLLTGVLHGLAWHFERQWGFWRAVGAWAMCGLYGSVLSAAVVPRAVTAGPSGCVFGWLAIQVVDMLTGGDKGCLRIVMCGATAGIGFVAGLIGFLDNWAHIGGFVFGLLLSLLFVNSDESRGASGSIGRIVATVLTLPVASFVFIITAVLFYSKVDAFAVGCEGCYKLNGVIWNDTCIGEACE